MKNVLLAVAVVVFFIGGIAATAHYSSRDGIITVPGYAHATYLCGNSLIVNVGHEGDPEVQELVALAKEKCPK